MRWEDERYVRVYTRDTGDWLLLSFEAQSVWLMMLRRFDRSGLIYVGRTGRRMLAAVLGHPEKQDVVDRGLDDLLADGMVQLSDDGQRLFAPNFAEAQDWVATPAERSKRYRDGKRMKSEGPVTNVTRVTQPSPLPSSLPSSLPPVLPQILAGTASQPPAAPKARKPKASKQEKPPDPRRRPLSDRLVAVFLEIRGQPYDFAGARDGKALAQLIAKGDDVEIERRWRIGLTGQFRKAVSNLAELAGKWNELTHADTGPPGRVVDLRKSPVRAEDIPLELFAKTGDVTSDF